MCPNGGARPAGRWSPRCSRPRRVCAGGQRRIFQAIILDHEPLDVLAAETGSNRNAIYKTLFDARRKTQAFLAANGYLDGAT